MALATLSPYKIKILEKEISDCEREIKKRLTRFGRELTSLTLEDTPIYNTVKPFINRSQWDEIIVFLQRKIKQVERFNELFEDLPKFRDGTIDEDSPEIKNLNKKLIHFFGKLPVSRFWKKHRLARDFSLFSRQIETSFRESIASFEEIKRLDNRCRTLQTILKRNS